MASEGFKGFKILPKLIHDHVSPTLISVMVVKCVVQILSKTKSVVLSTFETPDNTVTAKYCEIINSFHFPSKETLCIKVCFRCWLCGSM